MFVELTQNEIKILLQAATESNYADEISVKCPRCGSKIIIIEYEKSYVVRCEKEGCIEMTSRGI
ncbi:MAG: hypothetical protein GX802_06315 [Clostridiales bacterium]|nr:hypothetical protein [Clostridiales bacterium]